MPCAREAFKLTNYVSAESSATAPVVKLAAKSSAKPAVKPPIKTEGKPSTSATGALSDHETDDKHGLLDAWKPGDDGEQGSPDKDKDVDEDGADTKKTKKGSKKGGCAPDKKRRKDDKDDDADNDLGGVEGEEPAPKRSGEKSKRKRKADDKDDNRKKGDKKEDKKKKRMTGSAEDSAIHSDGGSSNASTLILPGKVTNDTAGSSAALAVDVGKDSAASGPDNTTGQETAEYDANAAGDAIKESKTDAERIDENTTGQDTAEYEANAAGDTIKESKTDAERIDENTTGQDIQKKNLHTDDISAASAGEPSKLKQDTTKYAFADLPDHLQELGVSYANSFTVPVRGAFRVCVNIKKQNFWLYGGTSAFDGKRNFAWAKHNGPVAAWTSLQRLLDDTCL
jgi:hypothetical protein